MARKTCSAVGIAIVALACRVGMAADELESGLKVGEAAGPFVVKDVTGPNAGKSLCYR